MAEMEKNSISNILFYIRKALFSIPKIPMGMLFVSICLAVVLWISVLPVEQSWTSSYAILAYLPIPFAIAGTILGVIGKKRLRFSAIDTIVVVWFVYAMGRAWLDNQYPCSGFVLNTLIIFELYCCLRLLFSASRPHDHVIPFFVVTCATYEAIIGISQLIQGHSLHSRYLLTGTFFNPGPYSAYIMMGLILAVGLYQKMSTRLIRGKWNAGIVVVPALYLFAILLPSTWSRSAILSAGVCLLIIFWHKIGKWRWIILLACLALGIGAYFMKQGSADGRGAIYYLSLLCIIKHPLIGSGIGSFFHQIAERTAELSSSGVDDMLRSVDALDYAFNALLQVGVEQGLIGMLLAISLFLLALRRLMKRQSVLTYGLLALVLFSMFSYPFGLLPYQIILAIMLAYAATDTDTAESVTTRQRIAAWSRLTVVLIGVCGMATITTPRAHERISAFRAYHSLTWYKAEDALAQCRDLLPELADQKRFLFYYGKQLSAAGRYNESNYILRQGALTSNDPMFYVVQGNNYREMKAYDEAEEAYRKAYRIMPNRLYPLYQLMLLYQKTGNEEKMKRMAEEVLSFEVKIASPATHDIKNTAREILHRQQ